VIYFFCAHPVFAGGITVISS